MFVSLSTDYPVYLKSCFVSVEFGLCVIVTPRVPVCVSLVLSCLVLSCPTCADYDVCVPGSRVAYEIIHSQAAASVSQHTRF